MSPSVSRCSPTAPLYGLSGKCYLSLHEQGKSANRGSCSQICRRSYEVKDKETGIELEIDNQYIMSPKDLKTIHFLNKMLDAGVRVLKIEGRARGPEYVDTVVRAYREAVDTYCAGNFTTDNVEKWDNHLGQVFNRGFWDGYYLGQRLGEWTSSYGSSATKQKATSLRRPSTSVRSVSGSSPSRVAS